MIKALLVGLVLACSLLDAVVTRKRIKQFGPAVELAGLVKRFGVWAGVGLPTLGWLTALSMLSSPLPLAAYAGAKCQFALMQLQSVKLDGMLPALRSQSAKSL